MSGWEQTHRRYRLVYAVAEDIARRGPAARNEWQQTIEAEYGSVDNFVSDVRRRWYNAVDAHLDDVRTKRLAEVEAEVSKANRPLRVLLEAFAGDQVRTEDGSRHAVQPA